jgi:hypothetical protein
MRILLIIFCFSIFASNAKAQNALRIHFKKLGMNASMDVFAGDKISYRAKGVRGLQKRKILALNDSLLVFENSEELELRRLKFIRIQKDNYTMRKFEKFFFRCGFAFIFLDGLNGLILHRPDMFQPKVLVIGAGLMGTAKLIHLFRYRKVRIRKSSVFIPITTNYSNLHQGK